MAVGLGLDSVDDETAHDCEDLQKSILMLLGAWDSRSGVWFLSWVVISQLFIRV